jgi:formyl-CoA transferase
MLKLCQDATIPISRVNTLSEVIEDPYVKEALLTAVDSVTKTRIHMAPAPYMTPFLAESNRELTFPPRLGEHNEGIYGELGYPPDRLQEMKEKKVI